MKNIFITLLLCMQTIIQCDEPLTPTLAFKKLQEGHQRFIEDKRICDKNILKKLEQSQDAQTPYAAILCCSDSRIPPELIFDESLGKLFVIRVAGNIATDVTIGSIEYAVAILKVPLVIVLGHESCGVLIAALKGYANLPPFINDLTDAVSRPVAQAKQEIKDSNFNQELELATLKNVQIQMRELLDKSTTLQKALQAKQTLLKGGIFHLKNGEMEWL